MKVNKLNIKILAITFTASFLGACSQDYIVNRQAETAIVGIEVFDAAEKTYDSLQVLDYYYDYNRKYLEILAGDSTTGYEKRKSIKNSYSKMSELIHYLQKLYRSYEMLSDINIGVDKSGIRPNFELLTMRLDSFEFSEANKIILNEIKLAAKAHKFETKDIMFQLSALTLDVIERDLATRTELAKSNYEHYTEQLKRVPVSAFDAEKIKPLVKEPLKNNDDIAKIYIMQLANDAFKKQLAAEAQVATLVKVLETLHRIHAEFVKQDKSNVNIDRFTAEIRQLLNIKQNK